MPKLGPSMEEGVLVKWHKAEGESVRAGEPLFDVETDKTVVEVEAEASGTLRKVLVRDGEKIPVGTVLGLIGGGDEPLPASSKAPDPAPTRPRASPAARRVARELGVDLASLQGTGPDGRIKALDVERAATPHGTAISLNAMRRAIGERMTVSKQTVPHFYAAIEADMTAVVAQRGAWSINDVLVWACARALKEHRALNSGWSNGRIILFDEINIGVAMTVSNGLVAPVLRGADGLALSQIAEQTSALAQKARDKKLTTFDAEGATFTLSNLGMFGVDWFIPIINPPQCAILGAGRVAERAVVQEGKVAVRAVMSLTLAADHRIVDGVAAGRFLGAIKKGLEEFTSTKGG